MRYFLVGLLVSMIAFLGCGQENNNGSSDRNSDAQMSESATQNTQKMSPNDSVSAEWQMRLDNPSRANKEDITIEETENGYHFVTGPRAIFYKSGMTSTAPYQYSAEFTQNNQPGPEAYGVFVGGENLQSEDQGYLYFLIRQTGEYLIKRRVGADTETIAGWSAHSAIQSVEENQKPVNKLAVEASSDSLSFYVNDQLIATTPAEKIQHIDGQAGIRINHRLDLTVQDIKLQ